MISTSIRPLQGEELLDVLYNFQMYAFRASPPFMDKEEWTRIVRERKGIKYHTLFEDERPVSSAASNGMTQNVRGKLFPACGIWGVVTLPQARRRGYCRQVMADLLSAERGEGKVFSNLYPFRESFYERLGYVTFPIPNVAKFSPTSLAPLLKMDLAGSVELSLFHEAYAEFIDYLTRIRPTIHGLGIFDIGDGDRIMAERKKLWVALARVNGEVEGMMTYKLEGEEVTKFKFLVNNFYYTSSNGKYLLLDWIARHIDQADRVEIHLPPLERPESWLSDLQVSIVSQSRAPMSRVLDVQKIGGMEVGEGTFSANITDSLCPFNNGTWRFDSIQGRLQVTKTDSADCNLTIQGLTALVYGTHTPEDFRLRGWGDPSPEVQSIMGKMLPPMTPYLHENF